MSEECVYGVWNEGTRAEREGGRDAIERGGREPKGQGSE